MIKTIESHTLVQHANAFASFLPGGDLFVAKNIHDSVFRQILNGLSHELLRAENYVKLLQEDFIPDKTINFISEWERALGIPDECFDTSGSPDIRRRNILAKLASLGVQTVSDFESLALLFGVIVTIVPGVESNEVFPFTFPLTFPLSAQEARFTIVVEYTPTSGVFPYIFPFVLGDNSATILECLFNKLKPANCQVLFKIV